MKTYEYAFNVIAYSRFRSCIVFILVFVTTVCIFGTGLFTDNIQNGARLYGTTDTDLYIVPEEYLDSTKDLLFKGKACTIMFRSDVTEKIKEIPEIEKVSPQLYLETLEMSCCSAGGIQIVAYDPKSDFSVSQWTDVSIDISPDEILVGSAGNFSKGETIDLFGRTFKVAGILEETGMGYDSSIFMTYDSANEITSSDEYAYMFGKKKNAVSMLLLRQKTGADMNTIIKKVTDSLEDSRLKVYAIDELASGLRSNIRMTTTMVKTMDIFVLMIAGVSLFAMVTVTSEQRRKTAGSLLSVGYGKNKILRLFFAEYLILFTAGTLLGIGISSVFLFPLHNVFKTLLDMPYKLITVGQGTELLLKTLAVNFTMLVTAVSFTFITVMKKEPAMLTGENV